MASSVLFGVAPTIYPDDWLRQFVASQEKLPPAKRSGLYRFLAPNDGVATYYRNCLVELERWIRMIEPNNCNKLVGQLRNEQNEQLYLGAIRELRTVGQFLDKGFRATYEPELDDKLTPDWMITDAKVCPLAILEFTQSKLPDEVARAEKSFNTLWLHYITPIAQKHGVTVFTSPLNQPVFLEDDDIKAIAIEVDEWLSRCPFVGAKLTTKGAEFTFQGPCEQLPAGGGAGGYPGDSSAENLGNKIEKKVQKYGHIAGRKSLPLLVVVFPDIETGQDYRTFMAALTGESSSDQTPAQDTSPIKPTDVANDSLFAKYPTLSAAGWLWLDSKTDSWSVQYVMNPRAIHSAAKLFP